MEKREKLFLVFILSFCCFVTLSAKQPVYALNQIDRKITSWVDSGYYNGAVLIIMKDNRLFYKNCYGGYSDTTVLHIASAGKWLAAAAIAAVVDEGRLSWSDKVSDYIPELRGAYRNATLRQLLSHTSGFPDYQPEGSLRDDYQTLEESVRNIAGLQADALPGLKFKYGGLAMQVAGRMAEIVTGKDWETIFQEKIALPLGMVNTGFTPVSKEGGFSPMLGGSAYTCARDYIRFLTMILNTGTYNKKRILSEAAIREMESDQVKDAKIPSLAYVECARQNFHKGIYGLGEWREELDGNGNAELISSPGWAGAYPWIDKKNNVCGFFLSKVNVAKANQDGFSAFYSSPVLATMTRNAITERNYPSGIKSGMADIGDAQLYYEEMGKGVPVIFIHGHSLDHKMWDKQFREFAKKYRTIRYDIRGYGYSSPQTETKQFTHVEDLVKLMNILHIEKAHIVGLSLGGYIGTDILGWFPGRVLSCVLASGNARPSPKPSIPMDSAEAALRDKEIINLKKFGIINMKREWFSGLMHSGGSRKSEMSASLWAMVHEWDAWQPLHKEVRVIAGGDAYDLLKKNKPGIPVMILEGKSDHNNYPDNPEILNYLPNGKLQELTDCGHMMNMEQPELFNKVVMKFISETK